MNDHLNGGGLHDLSAGGSRAAQQQQALMHMQREQAMQARVTAPQLAIAHHNGEGEAKSVVKTAATFETFIAGGAGPPTEQTQ